jgi:hypothetical protein
MEKATAVEEDGNEGSIRSKNVSKPLLAKMMEPNLNNYLGFVIMV